MRKEEVKLYSATKQQAERLLRFHITVEKEVEIKREYDNILAIDLGIRRIATVVSTADKRPKFYGKELRGIKGHYFYISKHCKAFIRHRLSFEFRYIYSF